MNIESIRDYCLSLPQTSEAFPFDERTLVFRVVDKIFACVDLERPEWATMKCDPDYAITLRDKYNGIRGAWHWNKKYWNEVMFDTDVPDELVYELIDHSQSEVLKKLPKKTQTAYAELTKH